jgi:hypothetical protein
MKQGAWTLLATGLALGMGTSCQSLSTHSTEWQLGCPPDSGVWARHLAEINFRETPFPEMVAELERAANACPGPRVSVSMFGLNPDYTSAVSLWLRDVELCKALQYIAEVSRTDVRYRGNDVEFTPRRPAECLVYRSVRCRGRAVDSSNGRPVDWIVLLPVPKVKADCREDALVVPVSSAGTYEAVFLVRAEAAPQFSECLAVLEMAFVSQVLTLHVSRPGYSWQTHELTIEPTNYVYHLDVELTPVPEANPPDAH